MSTELSTREEPAPPAQRLKGLLTLRFLDSREERALLLGLSVLHLGTGLSMSLQAIWLLRYLHVSPGALGLGLGVAAVLGILAGPVVGSLADRASGGRLYAALVWTMALSTVLFVVTGAWVALALLSVLTICGRGSAAVVGALVGRLVLPERRVRYRALVVSSTNAGMVVGLGAAAVLLGSQSRRALQVGFAVEAFTLVLAGALVWSVGAGRAGAIPAGQLDAGASGAEGNGGSSGEAGDGRVSGVAGDGEADAVSSGVTPAAAPVSRLDVLRDRRFVALTALNALFVISEALLAVALPLWLTSRTHAPLWTISMAMGISTCAVVLLQVPVSKRVSDLASATRIGRRGGFAYALAALAFPLLAWADRGWVAVAVVAGLAVAVVTGDLLYAAASWEIVYDLAPTEALGVYQGVYGAGWDVGMIVAAPLFAWIATSGGSPAWVALSVAFALAALLLGPICRKEPPARHTPVT